MGAETENHRLLKELAIVWLRGRGCHQIGTEVFVRHYRNPHHMADVVGIRKKYKYLASDSPDPLKAHMRREVEPESICIEVKVSRSDFHNGFVEEGCTISYLLTTPNLIDAIELPKSVGLLELDPSHYRVIGWGKRTPPLPTVEGMTVKKRAKHLPIDQHDVLQTQEYLLNFRSTPTLIAVLLNKYAAKPTFSE